jgi:hypothetical protein
MKLRCALDKVRERLRRASGARNNRLVNILLADVTATRAIGFTFSQVNGLCNSRLHGQDQLRRSLIDFRYSGARKTGYLSEFWSVLRGP